MELNPHNWHKRPADSGKEEPCTVCGCPAAGTRKGGTWHRATLASEGFSFRFVSRRPGRNGWEHKGLCPVARTTVDANRDLEAFARQLLGEGGEIPAASEVGADEPAQPAARVTEASNPGHTTLDLMARAATLHVMGKGFPAIAQAMKLKRRTIQTWKNHWSEHWAMACQSAETQLVRMVKAQIGTVAIFDDVDAFLERTKAAEQIATIIPAPDKPTLSTFFESYVLPTCFYDDKPRTIDTYRGALKLWRLITGDPPIEEITTETLTLYRDALSKRRGREANLESGNQYRHFPTALHSNHSGQGRSPGPAQPGRERTDCPRPLDSTAAGGNQTAAHGPRGNVETGL